MCVLSKRRSENSFWVKKTLGVDELLQEEKKAAWRPRFVWKERHLSKGKRKGWAGHCVGKPERGCASWLGLGGEVREEPVQWKYLGGNPKCWRTSSLYQDFTNPQWSIRPAYWCLAEASLVCFIFLWKPRRGWGLSQDQDESRSRVSPGDLEDSLQWVVLLWKAGPSVPQLIGGTPVPWGHGWGLVHPCHPCST